MFLRPVFKAQEQGPSFHVETERIGLDDTAAVRAAELQLAPLRDRLLDGRSAFDFGDARCHRHLQHIAA